MTRSRTLLLALAGVTLITSHLAGHARGGGMTADASAPVALPAPSPASQATQAGGVAGQGAAAAPATVVGQVMTVNGPIAPEALGMTLPHEHIFVDTNPRVDTDAGWRALGATRPSTPADRAFYLAPLTIDRIGAVYMGRPNRDQSRFDSEPMAVAAVTDYKYAGGGTIVEVTSTGIRRNPEGLRRVSRATGVNIVMGSSWYEHGYNGTALDARSVASLADEIVRDLTVGVGATGIRAGIIGEVGVKVATDPYERKLLAAAAQASNRTGAAISIHMSRGHHEQIDTLRLLKEAGADLTRVAMGHSNPIADNMPLMKHVVDSGAYIQFDLLGDPPTIKSEVVDHDVALAIASLLKQGYGRQILLSQDVFLKTDLKAYGGAGYSFIIEQFIPYLRRMGVTDEQIAQMTVGNPKRLLTLAAPKAVAR